MHRLRWIWTLMLAAAVSTAARASELGADGRIHFEANALATYGFEDAASLAPTMRLVTASANGASFAYTTISASMLAAHLVPSADAIEGSQMLHWTMADGLGLLIEDTAAFSAMSAQRISMSFWGRAEGLEPVVEVTYGNEIDFSTTAAETWARIPAIRTGRETSDGFVEYATGPIDGSILSRPIHDLILTARVPTNSGASLLTNTTGLAGMNAGVSIDAIEILPAAGALSSAGCTALSETQACGANGECFYGTCVDSAAIWHPVPPLAMQQEIVARVSHWASNFLGDRSALARVDSAWLAATSALASASATPKSFWRGLNYQVTSIRDTHTHLGAPYSGITTPFSPRPTIESGPLDVCFGPTINDLGDGQLAYVIWKVGSGAPSSLKVGDVITTIDGLGAKAWVDVVYPQYVASLPVVSGIEWSPSAHTLATLLAVHAGRLIVSRCTPGGTCAAQAPIDVPTLVQNALANGVYSHGTLSCTMRFTETVAGSHDDSGGGDAMLYAAFNSNTMALDFDGFSPTSSSAWEASVDAAFLLPHTNVIVDARLGHGGMNELGDYLNQQFRGTGAPTHLALAARGSFSDPNAASLFAFDWSQCPGSTPPAQCPLEDIYTYGPTKASPPGLASKVAWLDEDDFSNNDMVPKLMQGRANLQIFAPYSTYGALGSDVPIPALVLDWTEGSIAASDATYGTTIAAAETAENFQSGTGVSPDQVVTQTVSDVLAGKDTIVTAATAWLAQ